MFTSCLSSYVRRDEGATAVIFALALLPIVVMLGLSIDVQRANALKLHLQTSADAAALAGARQYYEGGDTAADVALAYFNASIAGMSHAPVCADPVIETNDALAAVTISAECSIGTTVSGIIGSDAIPISTIASARSQPTKLDLALMLDVSGSMAGSKIEDLKTASKNAIDILLTGSGHETRIALAPYSTAVNVGTYAETVVGSDTFDKDRDQATCVTERSGAAKKSDAAPGAKKYVGYETVSVSGKDIWCPSAGVLPLTHNQTTLKNRIDALTAGGWTAGQLGVAWSWYAISPKWDSVWPAASAPRAYDEPDAIKAVILMTDGAFNMTYDTKQGNSVNQSKVMCGEMRKAGVRIYAVAFQAPPSGQAVLQDCATSEDHYFEPEDGDELIAVYGEIATSLSNLRLSQ